MMKLAPIVLLGAALSFAAACHATPEAAPVEETAVATETAPMVMPRVGGPCSYETTVVVAAVTQVTDTSVQLSEPEARPFTLPSTVFSEAPVVGQEFNFTKRKITKSTCSPLIYSYDAPVEPEPDVPHPPMD